jgi:2-dehydro-3-deoxyphosphogluconate aldolase/(4S)-4-hydroxy-2-oxoglutarate aldolase
MNPLFDPALAETVADSGIVAVLVIDRPEDAVPLAAALLDGGVNVMELTLRTPAAIDSLKAIRKELPVMVAGVGTILTPDQLKLAQDSGAAFGVAPGTNPRVLAAARAAGFSFAPGVATPTDIEVAVENGCKLLKFFPCEPSGGLAYLKSIAAPFLHLGLRYLPLGGVNEKNMASYLSDPLIAALGGSWLAPREKVAAGDWSAITKLARDAVSVIKQTRGR